MSAVTKWEVRAHLNGDEPMINTISCPHCRRPISYERADLYTPERSLRIECATCKKPVLLEITEDGDVTSKPAD